LHKNLGNSIIDELGNRGYDPSNIPRDYYNAFSNLRENLDFAKNNSDVLLNVTTDVVTSTTAVAINSAIKIGTAGLVDAGITGEGLESSINNSMAVDWLGEKFYRWGWY
jgi:hypothetical protein